MDTKTVELDVKIEANDLYDYMLRHSYNSAAGMIGSCFGALILILAEMHKAVSTGKSIILYTSPMNATIFPKRQMEEQKVAVIEMISTHMPPAKVKIRN